MKGKIENPTSEKGFLERKSMPVNKETWKTKKQNELMMVTKGELESLKPDSLLETRITVQKGDTLGALAFALERAAKSKHKEALKQWEKADDPKPAKPEKELDINWKTDVHYRDESGKDTVVPLHKAKLLEPGQFVSFEKDENNKVKIIVATPSQPELKALEETPEQEQPQPETEEESPLELAPLEVMGESETKEEVSEEETPEQEIPEEPQPEPEIPTPETENKSSSWTEILSNPALFEKAPVTVQEVEDFDKKEFNAEAFTKLFKLDKPKEFIQGYGKTLEKFFTKQNIDDFADKNFWEKYTATNPEKYHKLFSREEDEALTPNFSDILEFIDLYPEYFVKSEKFRDFYFNAEVKMMEYMKKYNIPNAAWGITSFCEEAKENIKLLKEKDPANMEKWNKLQSYFERLPAEL
ncbi:hypothetical protein KJ632_05760 [Patescibacteria group bacterium]|nr:hypothetical protein [Patescibacteria group bacterium]